jgi:hypothetical protein
MDTVGRGKVNPVIHRKHHFKMTPKTEYISYYNAAVNGNVISQGPGPWAMESLASIAGTNQGWPSNSLPNGYTVDMSGVDESKMVQDLIENAKQLKADVLLNLVEANQLWPAVQSLTSSPGQLANLGANWRDVRRFIKTASGAFLAYQFGIKPVLSDMMNVHRYLPRLQQDIVRHGKGAASRFSIFAQLPCTYTPPPYGGQRLEAAGRALKPPTIRYVLVVKPKTKYHTSFFRKADFFMSRFASSPASLAWEKVPFSFVVDWFVDLRGTLNAIDKVIGSEPFEVVGFSRSFSYTLQSEISYGNTNGCTGAELWRSPQAQQMYTNYERSPVSSGGFAPVWRPRFGKNQASISAALISQQLSKLR